MKFSKTYKINGREFRYNYDDALLCWVYEDETIDEIGLIRDNWEENPEYWCETYYSRIEEEMAYL